MVAVSNSFAKFVYGRRKLGKNNLPIPLNMTVTVPVPETKC
jgi:hypothetical protein